MRLVCSTETIPIPVPLCKHHYHMVYNETQPHQEHRVTCRTALRRHSSSQVRVCPQPTIIQDYLKEHTEFEDTIKESDKVCYTCYHSHLVIIAQKSQCSTDSDLL